MSFFFFYKIREQGGRTGPVLEVGTIYIHFHVCKWKNETIPGIRGGGIMENDGGGEFNYDIL
jgi:hypothetical protein